MLHHPAFDPVALHLGPLKVHWYGLMYLCACAAAWWLASGRAKRAESPVKPDQLEDLIFNGALGVVLGGRLGYVLLYGSSHAGDDPLWIVRIWEGGMSFHGGLVGVMIAMWWFARSRAQPLGSVLDFVAPIVPLGLGFGRIGNFIGQELWGRPTDLSWGMVFPRDPSGLARHPSQLYQAFLEGVLLFAVVCGSRRALVRAGPWVVCSFRFTGSSAFWSSSCASPMRVSASWLSAGSHAGSSTACRC